MAGDDRPAGELVVPTTTDPVPDIAENIIGSTQFVSSSYWVGQALNALGLWNPWEYFSSEYAGDWRGVQAAGLAIGRLAAFDDGVAESLRARTGPGLAAWEGRAADAAGRYVADASTALEEHGRAVRDIGGEVEQIAVGMYEMSNGLKNLLEALTDTLIALGLEMAAFATVGWTVVGGVVSAAAAAATVTAAMGIWGKLIEAHGDVWTAVQILIGTVAGYLNGLGGLDEQVLAAAYDHPGVAA